MFSGTDCCCGIPIVFVVIFGLAFIIVRYTAIPDNWIDEIFFVLLILGIVALAVNYLMRQRLRENKEN